MPFQHNISASKTDIDQQDVMSALEQERHTTNRGLASVYTNSNEISV